MTYWITIAMAGLATYATRSIPLAVDLRGSIGAPARRYLDALPISLIAALVGTQVVAPNDTLTRGAEVVAAGAAVAASLARRDLLSGVLAGVATLALLRAAGLGT